MTAPGPSARMAGFIAHLRLNGFAAGPRETADALAALANVNPADPLQARLALKTLLSHDREAFGKFDELFEAYWLKRGRERAAAQEPEHRPEVRRPKIWDTNAEAQAGAHTSEDIRPDATPGEAESDGQGRLIATETHNLRRADLRNLVDPRELAEAERVAEQLARAIRDRLSRRRVAARRGAQLDLRRMIRASLGSGGDPIRLIRRRRLERPMRIVALLDVSGSMQAYSRVFLCFVKGLIGRWSRADAYLFHTRLVRVTDAMRDKDMPRSVKKLSLMAQGFGGGTRIAGALAAFNDRYAAQAVNGRTVVMIFSDGYDTDAPDKLAAELARLRKRAGRVIWLNPLLGWRGYEPVARGMAAALPHLDRFLAANTLESLAALESEFARL